MPEAEQIKTRKRTSDALRITRSEAGYASFTFDDAGGKTAPDLAAIRKIYNNQDEGYLLGSFIAAPVVDLLAGFIGRPRIKPEGEGMTEAASFLEGALASNAAAIAQAHRCALRDGKAYIMFAYEVPEGPLFGSSEAGRLTARVILADAMKVDRNPLTGLIVKAALLETITWTDEKDQAQSGTLKTTFTPAAITRELTGAQAKHPAITGLPEPNKWGFVPVVEIVNEPEGYGVAGVSEIERVAPLMRLYHKVLEAATKGSKLHSTPKLALWLADKASFLQANFPEAIEAIKSGTRPKINLSGRELLILDAEDKAGYIEANNPVGAAIDLLKLIFYCMVITAETPEFALGVHMSSSYASTMEQTPVWSMKVQRKQAQFTTPWNIAGRIMLAMYSKATGKKVPSYAVAVSWDLPDTRDRQAIAKQQYDTVMAVIAAVDGLLMSDKTAIETLRGVFPAMGSYEGQEGEASEKAEVKRTALERQALINEQAPASGQKADINQMLAGLLGGTQ